MLQDHGYRVYASRCVPVYAPAFAATKLHFGLRARRTMMMMKLHRLVTEAHWCEQLA